MKNLLDLSIGESGKVLSFENQGVVRKRLLDMGITTGVQIKLIKVAPMGDPLEIELRGYNLSLRKSEAKSINIE
ncbi:MAG: ferrous iron transport protein A [Sphaerochaetaceae bacterium]|jgi:ferrous iron transport protein A|nr:ferrous iron transport protein A [Sphaerochaetaceae bacterium]